MGANESTQIEGKIDLVKESYSEAYGKYHLMRDRETSKYYAIVEKYCLGDRELITMSNQIEKRKNVQSPYITKVFAMQKQNKQEYCSTYLRIVASVEYLPKSLREQIDQRKQRGSHYTEGEIIQMIQNVSSALKCLQEHKIVHGRISPNTILLDQSSRQIQRENSSEKRSASNTRVSSISEQQILNAKIVDSYNINNITQQKRSITYKITDIELLQENKSNYISFLNGEKSEYECYLSPELVESLFHRVMQPQYDVEKSDIFALGLCALEMALMSNVQDIYDFSNFRLLQEELKFKLERVELLYSQNLRVILSDMLQFDLTKRATYNKLINNLSFLAFGPQQSDLIFSNNSTNYAQSNNSSNTFQRQQLSLDSRPNNRIIQSAVISQQQQQQQQQQSQQYQQCLQQQQQPLPHLQQQFEQQPQTLLNSQQQIVEIPNVTKETQVTTSQPNDISKCIQLNAKNHVVIPIKQLPLLNSINQITTIPSPQRIDSENINLDDFNTPNNQPVNFMSPPRKQTTFIPSNFIANSSPSQIPVGEELNKISKESIYFLDENQQSIPLPQETISYQKVRALSQTDSRKVMINQPIQPRESSPTTYLINKKLNDQSSQSISNTIPFQEQFQLLPVVTPDCKQFQQEQIPPYEQQNNKITESNNNLSISNLQKGILNTLPEQSTNKQNNRYTMQAKISQQLKQIQPNLLKIDQSYQQSLHSQSKLNSLSQTNSIPVKHGKGAITPPKNKYLLNEKQQELKNKQQYQQENINNSLQVTKPNNIHSIYTLSSSNQRMSTDYNNLYSHTKEKQDNSVHLKNNNLTDKYQTTDIHIKRSIDSSQADQQQYKDFTKTLDMLYSRIDRIDESLSKSHSQKVRSNSTASLKQFSNLSYNNKQNNNVNKNISPSQRRNNNDFQDNFEVQKLQEKINNLYPPQPHQPQTAIKIPKPRGSLSYLSSYSSQKNQYYMNQNNQFVPSYQQ